MQRMNLEAERARILAVLVDLPANPIVDEIQDLFEELLKENERLTKLLNELTNTGLEFTIWQE